MDFVLSVRLDDNDDDDDDADDDDWNKVDRRKIEIEKIIESKR